MLPIKDFFSRQFLVFLAVGATAASVNFFSRFLFRPYLPYVASVGCAFAVGTVVSFVLNRTITFKAFGESIGWQAVKFTIAALGAIGIAAVIAYLGMALYHSSGVSFISEEEAESWVHLGTIGLNVIYSFLVMKYFALKK